MTMEPDFCSLGGRATREQIGIAAKTRGGDQPDLAWPMLTVLAERRGSSFGAAVAIYAGGIDKRIACVISSGGWGHGHHHHHRGW
mgnify:CR=1 FL=1